MAAKQSLKKKCIYGHKRYWYHVSSTLRGKEVRLRPWDEEDGVNRANSEPPGARICVAPTIEQCIAAIPYTLGQRLTIYRTKHKCMPKPSHDVFDCHITQEGWLTTPTRFVLVGKLNFSDIEKSRKGKHVITEAGSKNSVSYSGKVLRWWKRLKIKRFIKPPTSKMKFLDPRKYKTRHYFTGKKA